jgi:phage FluMu gp28-like protein
MRRLRRNLEEHRPVPRTFRPDRLFFERHQLRLDVSVVEAAARLKVKAETGDTTKFLIDYCKLKPFKHTLEIAKMYLQYQFMAIRLPRQTGKSTTIGALILQDAWEHPDLYIGFIGPSWRQTKLNIRRVANFCRNLPPQGVQVQRTRITLPNGSVIEAFPNNPDTIRGNTFDRLWWDETNFTPNDEDLYDAILFAMSTKKDAKFIATSTPFNTDSLFWKMCNHEDFADFGRYHISWEQALEPYGPLSTSMVEKIRRQFGNDSARWRREMEAEWAEDEDVWLAQSLIVSCIDSSLLPYDFLDQPPFSEFYIGVDFGKERDYSIVVVVEKQGDVLRVVHVHRFPLHTEYASVIGYVKSLQDRWNSTRSVYADVTGVGDYIVEDMVRSGIQGVTGVTFTVQSKEEMANILREKMRAGEVKIPYVPARKLGDIDLTAELNVEKYELMKTGHLGFSHPEGTHDDVFWSTALAVLGSVKTPLPGRGAVMGS